MRLVWSELFTCASSAEGGASKQLAPQHWRSPGALFSQTPLAVRQEFSTPVHETTNCRAITSRCTSLVPSPIVQSLESRQYFSGG
jgi:hypothetical protein